MQSFAGKIVLITGGSRGLGRALATIAEIENSGGFVVAIQANQSHLRMHFPYQF